MKESKDSRKSLYGLHPRKILYLPEKKQQSLVIPAPQRRIRAMKMRCYRKTLWIISNKDHVTNERSLCQDPAGNWTTRRPPGHRKETQTAVVWTYLPFIKSGQNHLARHSERGKKIRQTEKEVERQHHGMDRLGVRQVQEGNGEPRKMDETGCEFVSGAPTTPAV